MFTEEQSKSLDEKLAAMGEKLLTQLGETVNKTVSGMAKRIISDELPKAIAGQFTPLEEKLSGLQLSEEKQRSLLRSEMDDWLEELNKQALDEAEETPAVAPTTTVDGTSVPGAELIALAEARSNAGMTDLRNQLSGQAKNYSHELDKMREEVAAAKKVALEERKIREKLAEENRINSMEQSVLQELRTHVRPNTEKQLLTLLKTEGMLIEDKENNQYRIKSKDEFGLDTTVEVAKGAADLVRNSFPHFEEVRPGTGTSASPGSGMTTPSGGKWFGDNRVPTMDAMQDPAQLQEMLKELDARVSQ